MALIDDLVSWWPLDEASGTRLDAHGSNDLTDTNTVGTAEGGADFERDNSERLSIADASQSGLDFTSAMSIAMTLKPETKPSTGAGAVEYYLVSKLAASGTFAYRILWQTSSTINRLYLSTSPNGTSLTNGIINYTLNAGTEYHLLITKSGTTATFYIDVAP